ncbi:PD-(D/E)XK nuclease family protein [Thermogemmata fonticola]|uniref:PD-(D/E)XK nuclease family protein n=1 Tax=Thermogemmata fonticola TaxID=2755323 RepID=A0A7V8VF54_9BACT|nr:PD-(D/E)XK nuclease family protein [Thermogemmata fonticola]MBA2226895.1 PD-(D/E)XK nuclease family protein [Thermogemmata fonticola]
MAEMIRLVLSPSRAARWQRLEEEYERLQRGYGKARVLWLTASRRQAEQRRQRRGERAQDQIRDLQSFADALVHHHAGSFAELSEGDRRQWVWDTLQQCQSSLHYYKRVWDKRGFVERLAGTVAELEEAGISPQLWEETLQNLAGGAGQALQELALLYREYDRRRQQAHALSQAQRQFRAADLWYQNRREPFSELRGVIVTGYVELPRSTAMLLEALAESGIEVWGEAPQVQQGPGLDYHGWSLLAAEKLQPILLPADGSAPPPPSFPAQLRLIEAAGALGEARLIARQVRHWLDQGVPAERILLATRDSQGRLAELYDEVAQEYAVPLAVDRRLPLIRHPVVGFFLLALHVAARHWRFRDVTALLRHSYFRPAWDENDEQRYAAEAFLRRLGIPRGRRALENAIRYWTEQAQKILQESEPQVSPAKAENESQTSAKISRENFPHSSAEDSDEEGSPSQRLPELALQCQDFWRELFRHYDAVGIGNQKTAVSEEEAELAAAEVAESAEGEAGPTEPEVSLVRSEGELLARLRGFAESLGLRPEVLDADEKVVVELLWQSLAGGLQRQRVQSWAELAAYVERVVTLREYTPAGSSGATGAVRLVEAEEAAGLECDYLVLLNMGEGSWPRLNRRETLLADGQRQRLRQAGLPLETAEQRFASEQLLFATLTAAPRQELVLSYAAFDANGESLLPAAFVQQWREQLGTQPLTVLQQKMLLDGYWTQKPLSAAEQRVQYAHAWARGRKADRRSYPAVTEEIEQVLERARQMVEARWARPEYTPYDGRLQNPTAVRMVQQLFDDQCLFNPTALETYLSCPFRFFAQHVLGLQRLPDPAEEIEHTRRGVVLHEALARFHRELAEHGQDRALIQELAAEAAAEAAARRDKAGKAADSENDTAQTAEGNEAEPPWVRRLAELIAEEVERQLPQGHSRLVREIWRWEGVRLRSYARRYWRQWRQLMGRCHKAGLVPQPVAFEEGFGTGERDCQVEAAGLSIRVSGRIDRVDQDLAGSGIWIIDYKTGRGSGYTAAEVERLERLQLPVYALAWEKLAQGGGTSPPVRGLIYWFVTGAGPKIMWPPYRGRSSTDAGSPNWERFRERTVQRLRQVVTAIRQGCFPLAPRERECTRFCPFATMCRISQSRGRKQQRWEWLLEPEGPTSPAPSSPAEDEPCA